jgi:phage gp37-like protein
MPRVFDCVILENEEQLSLLEARFCELEGIPEVTHVICEAEADHQGNPKGMFFLDDPRFGEWRGRWNHVAVRAGELPSDCDPRGRKDALRDYLAHGFNGEPADTVMHGNIDEIPAAWMAFRLARGESELPVTLSMRHCRGHAGTVLPGEWAGTAAHQRQHAGSFSGLRRRRKEFPLVISAGTRLSAMGKDYTEGVSWQKGIDASWPRYIREGLCPGEWWQDQGECEPRQQLLSENS